MINARPAAGSMNAILDVYYGPDRASAACVLFRSWNDGRPEDVVTASMFQIAIPTKFRT